MGVAMPSESPLVTIGMPLFNEARHLKMTIASLLGQNFRRFRIIASNNGSTDETWQILETYAAMDNRITLFNQPETLVASANIKFVVDACDTPFFMMAAGHDVYDPDFIERTLQSLLTQPEVILAYPMSAWFNEAGVQSLIPGVFETRGMMPLQRMHTVAWGLVYGFQFYGIYRHKILKAAMDADDLSGVIGFDHIILTRLAAAGAFALVQETLFYMRQNDDFGRHDSYLKKVTGSDASDNAFKPYIDQIGHYLDIADDLMLSRADRYLLKVSLLQCGLLRYRNTLEITHGSFDDFINSSLLHDFLKQQGLLSVLPG